jgi:hypothetical protein
LEAEGRVELDRPGLALSYAGAKYHLINAGAAKPLPP